MKRRGLFSKIRKGIAAANDWEADQLRLYHAGEPLDLDTSPLIYGFDEENDEIEAVVVNEMDDEDDDKEEADAAERVAARPSKRKIAEDEDEDEENGGRGELAEDEDIVPEPETKKFKAIKKISAPRLHARDETSLTIVWDKVEGATGYRGRMRRDDDPEWAMLSTGLIKSEAARKKNLEVGKGYVFSIKPEFESELGAADGDENGWGWSPCSDRLVPCAAPAPSSALSPSPSASSSSKASSHHQHKQQQQQPQHQHQQHQQQQQQQHINNWSPFYLMKSSNNEHDEPRCLSVADLLSQPSADKKSNPIKCKWGRCVLLCAVCCVLCAVCWCVSCVLCSVCLTPSSLPSITQPSLSSRCWVAGNRRKS
jgi:hypothetical protein